MNKGYYILENFISEEDYSYFLNLCESVYEETKHNTSEHYSWNSKNNLNKIEGACDLHSEFLKLASHPKLVQTAKDILKTDDTIDCYISKFFPMEPEVGVSTFMHQDNYYFNGDKDRIISCAVYLQDTNKENGCLRLVEGSNTKGIFPHDIESGIPYVKWIDDKLLEDYNIIDLELKAPYAVFFDINMVHGCYPNKSDGTRFSLAWEYIESSNMDVQMSNDTWCDRNMVG